MLTIDRIKTAASKLADYYPIKKVSLFGSYAEGTADETSDVDLLMEDELRKKVDIVHAPILNGSLLKLNKLNKVVELYKIAF